MSPTGSAGMIVAGGIGLASGLAGGLAGGSARRAQLARRNDRLAVQLATALRELSVSRSRGVLIADRERRWIERDLHDVAQQTLVSIRIRLSMLHERLERTAPAEAPLAAELGVQIQAALDEVRALAAAVYPPLLAEQGLAAALTAAARSAPLPVRLELEASGRYRSDVESTVYFTCMEALENAVRHAHGAALVTIALRDDGRLNFSVRDDGAGFSESPPPGGGLAKMRERLHAVGGEIEVVSKLGEGTVVFGTAPAGVSPAMPVSVP